MGVEMSLTTFHDVKQHTFVANHYAPEGWVKLALTQPTRAVSTYEHSQQNKENLRAHTYFAKIC